jgi:acetyl-CoA acetyltransferase
MSDSDVFIISAVSNIDSAQAIQQAINNAGINSIRVQDVIFGLESGRFLPYHEPRSIDTEKIISDSGLTCSAATVSSSLRATFFAAQSILSFDVDVVIVIGAQANASTALLLASPDAVGRWNLMPRARLAARSLNGIESALRAAGLTSSDVTMSKDGKYGALLIKELLDELEGHSARWGMITENELVLLIERI